jgi:hypothetical protein
MLQLIYDLRFKKAQRLPSETTDQRENPKKNSVKEDFLVG